MQQGIGVTVLPSAHSAAYRANGNQHPNGAVIAVGILVVAVLYLALLRAITKRR